MERILKFMGKVLPDPGPEFDPEAVRELYAAQYPQLASASIVEREEDGVRVVEFVPRVGTKG
ncbi:PRTRC system protein C [Thermus scotoductus]|uniref:Carbamoylphosphate synthase large subunit n=2 Tax=Thermus scotoductus TaxID=37636 RepID=A0A430R599_THESC|nr:PRTRC system protein C [Thermus scotoductus]RTG94880.1 carbamoylphosphate synthase large subunit [Thermus scotoductus]RTH02585.1 carbamoylphosphate synthase large subunit [Thermus scotoductus]RTH18260.1 carbamoylphosphate synthase large subunit [Thermus scotoductus]RTH99191.1 carbamoylphosphate synthase large subunit [Thermus scotoductus]RTI21177.1 carbamoylphosphate synthase large subunit [Thermus scotoductus]